METRVIVVDAWSKASITCVSVGTIKHRTIQEPTNCAHISVIDYTGILSLFQYLSLILLGLLMGKFCLLREYQLLSFYLLYLLLQLFLLFVEAFFLNKSICTSAPCISLILNFPLLFFNLGLKARFFDFLCLSLCKTCHFHLLSL